MFFVNTWQDLSYFSISVKLLIIVNYYTKHYYIYNILIKSKKDYFCKSFISHSHIKIAHVFLQTYKKIYQRIEFDCTQLYAIASPMWIVVIKSKRDDCCKSFISHSIKIAHFCANI